jgi:hypothetical protein
MVTISREIRVQAPPPESNAAWDEFIRRALGGRSKLACDELVCVNAVENGSVAFAPSEGGATRVMFRLDIPDGEPALPEAELAHHMTHDLILFKDFVEQGSRGAGQPTAEEVAALERESDARGDKPRHVRLSSETDTTFWRSHFPT